MATLTSKLIVSLKDMVSGPARGVGASLDRLNRRATRMNSSIVGVGGAFGGGMLRGALAVGASYYGVSKAIGGTVGSAIKFEEAFADVRKVVDGTPAQLSAVRSEILAMSKDLPVTAEGIASIYAAAGQSGVALNELGKFSEMAAKVSVAWDTSQSETGDALAKIKTQLGLNVDELGVYADAINHLSNNTASAAPDLVEYAKRVAAVGKIAGFQTTETLAFGSAMISSGARSEVAATSFRNMSRALTKGEQATKAQRVAFGKLGLDSIKTAKGMQKNALKTTLDVLEKIQKLPEWQRISIASALFGDEARGLMPVIANTKELRRELGMVASEATFAGSAFQEYLVRSTTTANALQLIGNKFRAVGIGIGDGWLPTIKELGLGIGDVLDTLDKRVGVLDKVKSSFQALMGGLGYGGTGGTREVINDLGDLLFGKAFGGSLKDADDRVIGLARLSNRFRGIGQDLKSFGDNVSGGNIGAAISNVGDAIQKMGGGMTVGGAIAIALTGRALLALGAGAAALAFSKTGQIFFMAMAASALINAVKDAASLGEFVENLKGLSALEWAGVGAGLLMVATRAARVVGWFRKIASAAPKAPGVPTVATAPKAAGGGIAAFLGRLTPFLAMLTLSGDKPKGSAGINQQQLDRDTDVWTALRGYDRNGSGAMHRGRRDRGEVERDDSLGSFLAGPSRAGGPADVSLVGVPEISIPGPVTTQPSGTQDVRITNPQPAPNITVHVTATQDPQAIAAAAVAAISAKWNALSNGAFSDGSN